VVLLALQSRLAWLILQTWGPAEALAILAVAARFIEAAKMPSFALFGASFTQLAKLKEDGAAFARLESRLGALLTAYALLVFGAIILLGEGVILWSFGPAFAEAYPPLLILGLGLWPTLWRQNWLHARYAAGEEGRANQVLVLSLGLYLALGLLLIPPQPTATRAAIALLLAEGLSWGLGYVKIIPPLSSGH
jgi:O-antigen/teichoic acid export membrane protein